LSLLERLLGTQPILRYRLVLARQRTDLGAITEDKFIELISRALMQTLFVSWDIG
jgi:hypothetical protein